MKLNFLKDRYDFELTRKEQLTSALALPVGVLSGLGGLMIATVRSFQPKNVWVFRLFELVFVFDAAAFIACLVLLARAYHRQDYMYLAKLKELQDWENDYIGLNSYDAAMGKMDEAFERHLGDRIIEAADWNSETNDGRSDLLHRARWALFAVLLFTTFEGVLYVVNQWVR